MSKGLEALENLCNQCEFYQFEKGLRPKKCPHNKNCVFKQRIEKELKALEILKAFEFEIEDYTESEHGSIKIKCNRIIVDDEEIDLLKEVLKDD